MLMLCYAMLCFAMLCYAMLCYAMLQPGEPPVRASHVLKPPCIFIIIIHIISMIIRSHLRIKSFWLE